MSVKVSPGVLLLCDFVQTSDACSAFGGFVNYMDRPEAFQEVRTFDGDTWETLHRSDPVYGGYLDYMRNDEKSDGIFTSGSDRVDSAQVESLAESFNRSQALGCPLYRGVISFDNDFLLEQGLLFDSELDRARLKEITRESVTKLIMLSQLDPDNLTWTAAIHTNTDNVHVHFAMIEKKKIDRRYDMLPQKAIDHAKTTVVNKLIGSEASILRSALLRDDLLPAMKMAAGNQGDLLIELFSKLPEDARWEYNRKNFEPFQKHVDATVDKIVASDPYAKQSFAAFSQNLDDYTSKLRRYYGDGDRLLWENVKGDRLREFYERAGNALLQEAQKSQTISISELEKSGKYNLDQICAIREAQKKNLDASCIMDPNISGAMSWTVVRLMEAGTSPEDVKNILAAGVDPRVMELAAWVLESGKNPAALFEKAWSQEQALIISIALRHDLDISTLSDPAMPAKKMDKELQRLAQLTKTEKEFPNWNPDRFFLDLAAEQPQESKNFSIFTERTVKIGKTENTTSAAERSAADVKIEKLSLREEYNKLQQIRQNKLVCLPIVPIEEKGVWNRQRREQTSIVSAQSISLVKKLNHQYARHIKDLEREFDREQQQDKNRS